jgi:hypothetical protein
MGKIIVMYMDADKKYSGQCGQNILIMGTARIIIQCGQKRAGIPVDVGCGPNHTPERALDARAATDRRT